MARLFDDGSSEYLTHASAVLTATPISIACWFYSDDNAVLQTLVTITDTATADKYFRLRISGVDPWSVGAQTKSTGVNDVAASSSGYTENTWHHAAGVWASSTSRAAYIDGGSKGTSAEDITPVGLDTTSIGALLTVSPIHYMSGRIAEVGIWNVALTDAEIAILATGIRPIYVRPQNLVLYAPLWRDEDEDYVGGLSFTAVNTPSIASHPPIVWQPMGFWGLLETGATVYKDLQAKWDILELVYKDIQAKWDILSAQVYKDLQAKYDIFNLVYKDVQAKWDIFGEVYKDIEGKYDIFNLVYKDIQAKWDILELVSKDLQAKWDILSEVYKDLQAKWDMGGVVGKNMQVKWDILGEGIAQIGRGINFFLGFFKR